MVNTNYACNLNIQNFMKNSGSELSAVKKELRERNKSDQVISKSSHDGESERAPGPGHKPQATSSKPQAPSIKLSNQPEQATSHKLQAPSNKRQA